MKQKELKNIAIKIAKNEFIIQTSKDKEEVEKAQDEILKLSHRVSSLEDMMILDDLIQDLMTKISWLWKKNLI